MTGLASLSGLSLLAPVVAGAAGWFGVSGPRLLVPRVAAAHTPPPMRPPSGADREPAGDDVTRVASDATGTPDGGGHAPSQPFPLTVAVPILLGAAVVALSGSLPVGLLVLVGAGALGQRRRALIRVRDRALRRASVLELCTATVAELRAGRPPRHALARAAGGLPYQPYQGRTVPTGRRVTGRGTTGRRASGAPARVASRPAHGMAPAAGQRQDLATQLQAALRYDSDMPAVLRRMAARPGAEGLRRLAACWEVAEGSGAGLATATDRLAAGLRAEEAQRREISAQLAGPRTTARLLAVLPVFGLLLAAGLGGDPVHVLLGTPYGLACLSAGVALDIAGVLWTERIASAAEAAR
jgi:tight adherence protein B